MDEDVSKGHTEDLDKLKSKLVINEYMLRGGYYLCDHCKAVFFSEERACKAECPRCRSKQFHFVVVGKKFKL